MAQSQEMPPFDDLMWPTLAALKDSGGSASNRELLARVVQIMNLSEEIQNTPHGDGPRTELEYGSCGREHISGKPAQSTAVSVPYGTLLRLGAA